MSKKKKGGAPEKTIEEDVFSPAGLRLMIAGVILLSVGFLVLSKADPLGQNWAGTTSPFMILGGYALIGLGVFWKEGGNKSAGVSAPPPAELPRS